MNIADLAQILEHNAEIIRHLLEGISAEQARWKPDAETWSLLEIVNHLADEEREDFRAHLDHILHHPEQPWPPIDPMGWVTTRGYNARDLPGSRARFLHERERSLAWLRGLDAPNWDESVQAPWGDPIRAGDMAASWATHDLWHIQQLVQVHRACVIQQLAPYHVRYAGTL